MCKPSARDGDDQQQDESESKPLVVNFPEDNEADVSRDTIKLRMTKNLFQRSCLAAFACLQNALVGGLVFGWASIDRTLLVAERAKGGAGLAPQETTLIFSWASCVAMLSSLLMGVILDKYGPRTASVVSNLLILAGCQLFAVASSFHVFAIATCMMAFGGPGISSAIVHIANLFPRNQFLVMSCLCGSITFSFSILAVFGNLWETHGLGFRTLFGGYVAVIAASTLGSFFFWSDTPYEKEDSDEFYKGDYGVGLDEEQCLIQQHEITPEQDFVEATLSHHQLLEEPLDSGLRQNLAYGRTRSYYQSAKAIKNGNMGAISLKDQPFWNQILSKTYLQNLVIFVTTSFFVNFTIASFSTELEDQQVFSIDTQHDLSRSFTLIMSCGLVASILVGWLMDRVGLEACTIVTLLLGQASLLLRVVGHSYPIMMVGYVCYTLFRQFLFPVFIACLTARLGFKYFGILSGLGFALSGIAQIFMASLVRMLAGDCHLQEDSIYATVPCHHGRWTSFHLLQISLLALLTLIPIMTWRDNAKQQHRQSFAISKAAEACASPDTSLDSASSHSTASLPPPPSGLLGNAFAKFNYGSV